MLWLGGPVSQWIWDISAPRKHRKFNFVITKCVFCNVGGGRCEQLFRWGAFVSECLGAHGSDDESGDDSISATVWEAISAQSNSFVMEKHEFWCRNAKHSHRTVDQCPEQWGELLLSFLLKSHQTNPQGNYQQNLEYRVRPCLAKYLLMKLGRLIFENEISDLDMRRHEACAMLLERIPTVHMMIWKVSP